MNSRAPGRSLATAALGACALIVGGCSFDDPTELTFYVKIVNDTSRTVVLSNCATGDTRCNGKLYDPEPLKPGGVFPTVQTTVGAPDVELVQSPSGKRLGCLPLIFDYRASGTLVRVSEFVPCQKRYPTRSKASRLTRAAFR